MTAAFRAALARFDRAMPGFAGPSGLLHAAETRTSAPLRIDRGEDLQSVSLPGLYPCGEGREGLLALNIILEISVQENSAIPCIGRGDGRGCFCTRVPFLCTGIGGRMLEVNWACGACSACKHLWISSST